MRLSVPATRRFFLTLTAVLFLTFTVGVYFVFHTKTLQQRKVDINQLSQAYEIGKVVYSVDRQTTLQPNASDIVQQMIHQSITKGVGALEEPKVKETLEVPQGCQQSFTNADRTTVNTIPVDNFRRYPCVLGLPIFPRDKWPTEGKCVRTFCYSEGIYKTNKNCVSLRTFRGTTPICTYPVDKDIWVSGSIHRTGQWEGDLVYRQSVVFAARPELEFLDLGCNIGTYTLALAQQGVKVTAIDPMLENLELLSQSLKLGNLRENVTLIWNAVSNKRQLITFKDARNNVGGTQIQGANLTNSHGYMARTILLDDLIPLFRGKQIIIKMDIETTEYFALLGGKRFFDEVDVVVIQLEFAFHKTGPYGMRILELLSSKGYSPFRDISIHYPLNHLALKTWPGDIYFIKP